MGFAESVSRPETFLRNFVTRKWRDTQAGSGVAGHHSYVVTADTYGHVLAESKREMADTMSKLLGKEQAV